MLFQITFHSVYFVLFHNKLFEVLTQSLLSQYFQMTFHS